MSTDTHSPFVASFRCEAVTSHTIAPSCRHSKLANMPHLEPADVGRGLSHRDDPAVLIGLALAFVRQGHLLDGLVPEPLILRLSALADGGNPACRLLLDWLRNRNRDFAWVPNERLTRLAPVTASADIQFRRRSPRERVLAASKKPGYHDRRKRIRTRPRDPVRNPETETGGRVDG